LVRDERGQKMSKSKGNIIDPLDLIARYGTDALRFTLTALAAQGRDIKLAESRIEGYRNFATKLWNASRFAEMNGCVRVPGFDPASAKLTVNRWIAAAANAAGTRVARAIEEYKFNDAADALYQFTWGNFCDWYIEFSKPILTGSDEAAKAETRAMTIWVIERIVHLLHPIMPYITETLWTHIAGENAGMLITARWPEMRAAADQAAVAEMEWVVNLISAIRTTRSEMNVPAASELNATITEIRPDARGWIETHGEQIRRLARLKTIAIGAGDAKTALQIVVEGTTVLIDVAGAVDLAKERARLQKEIAATRSELDKIAKKLGNDQFMAKAKPEAIEEQRERQGDYEATQAKLEAALARIGA
ncbi:MAG TPA: class I tRNA ligase family protein, partial [Stellaceae bacterium]|nr:class I tRNA ligase family protein [Stellaceae bacterium]